MNVNIRWLIRRDLQEVMAIDSQCFHRAWTTDDFIAVLKRRNCIGVIAEQGEPHCGPIMGFMIYELHPLAFRIITMAVGPSFQRLSVGTQLIDRLKGKLSQEGRRRIITFVRESNVAAQMFFAHCGLRVATIKRGHHTDTREDAYEFQYLHLNDYSEEDSQWTHARSEQCF